jgi:hypothetical protein
MTRVSVYDGRAMAAKPTMFIGSSVEGKGIAETIQVLLDYDVASTVWHQGVFDLSGNTLETLVEALPEYDFATLVLTADDLVEKRQHTAKAPRDNVIFELGLFMGALGRRRTFVVHSRADCPMLPTDLAGITTATYEPRSNLDAALGPACTQIKRAIERAGARSRGSVPPPVPPQPRPDARRAGEDRRRAGAHAVIAIQAARIGAGGSGRSGRLRLPCGRVAKLRRNQRVRGGHRQATICLLLPGRLRTHRRILRVSPVRR